MENHEKIDDKKIIELLKNSKTIAVVGISRNPDKFAYKIPRFLKKKGYKIIPVNPYAEIILGEKSINSLKDINTKVDIVDIFRPGEEAYGIVKQAIPLKPKAIWMQEGIVNLKAKKEAEKNGILVIMDRCIKKEYDRLLGSKE